MHLEKLFSVLFYSIEIYLLTILTECRFHTCHWRKAVAILCAARQASIGYSKLRTRENRSGSEAEDQHVRRCYSRKRVPRQPRKTAQNYHAWSALYWSWLILVESVALIDNLLEDGVS